MKILNPDSSGVGRVLIKGPNIMQGYFKKPKLTQEAIKDGWFYSSDLGYIDEEGYLFLAGRGEELIVLSSGKNIYPEELEAYYLQSPHIKEMCIFLKQDKIFGHKKDTLFAVIVPDLEYFGYKKEVNTYEKIRWDLDTLSRNLPSHQHIMGFSLTTEELERTPLRKLKRFAVAQKYLQERPAEIKEKEAALTEHDHVVLHKKVAKRIIDYISKEIDKPVNLNSHLEIDLGIDSLSRVELGVGLEALLKLKIPDEMLYNVSTVKDVIVAVEGLMGGVVIPTEKEIIEQKSWSNILREPPADTIRQKIQLDFGVSQKLVSVFFKAVFLFIFRLGWLLRIEARENLPRRGPYLICPNHASYLDGLFIFTSLPLNTCLETYFLGFQRIFGHPLLSWMNKIGRLLSIDTDKNFTEAMQAVSFVLSAKKIVYVFPEGMRSIDTDVKEFKRGVGIIIKELDIPVVPVYIKGSHYAWPRGRRLPQPYPVKVVFGRTFGYEELKQEGERLGAKDAYEAIAAGLREEVLKLKEKEEGKR